MNGSTPTSLIQSVQLLDPVGHSATYTHDYSYDSMNRLTNAEVYNSSNQEVQDWSYSYDQAGNRTQSSVLSTGALQFEALLFIAGIPIVGPPIAILLAFGAFYALVNGVIFIYNSVIAPNCGWTAPLRPVLAHFR